MFVSEITEKREDNLSHVCQFDVSSVTDEHIPLGTHILIVQKVIISLQK